MGTKRNYELMLLFSGDLIEEDVRKELDLIKRELAQLGADKIEEEYWGRKDLAYKVGSGYSGYYAFLRMLMDGEGIRKFKANLTNNEKVVREMVTKTGGY